MARTVGMLWLVSLWAAEHPAHAEQEVNTSPGEEAVFLSINDKSMPLDGLPVFPDAVIARGKRNHVLTVTASVHTFSFDDKDIGMYAVVNNVFLRPPYMRQLNACPISVSSSCAVMATWIADLDALEEAHPGKFVGQPLSVEVGIQDSRNRYAPRSVSGTLIVRMERTSGRTVAPDKR